MKIAVTMSWKQLYYLLFGELSDLCLTICIDLLHCCYQGKKWKTTNCCSESLQCSIIQCSYSPLPTTHYCLLCQHHQCQSPESKLCFDFCPQLVTEIIKAWSQWAYLNLKHSASTVLHKGRQCPWSREVIAFLMKHPVSAACIYRVEGTQEEKQCHQLQQYIR